jgi:ABC-type transporter Mla subunit MlaD
VGGTVKVDPDALEALGQRLTNLQARLDSLARDIGAYDAAIGAPKLKSTLSELVSWWTASRRALGQELANLGSLASTAAAQYRTTEKDLSADVNRLPTGRG